MAVFPLKTESFPQPGGTTPLGGTRNGGHVTDVDDPNDHPEDDLSLPWCINPVATWWDYRCSVEIQLDPGSVLHKQLPQTNPSWDTLGVVDITDAAFAAGTNGVNLNSNSAAVDIIQRMASSTYRFILRGNGLRAGYQIPVPSLVKVGTVLAVPTSPMFANPEIVGNLLGGIPLWFNQWELHYIVGSSPKITALSQQPIPPNPAAAIGPNAPLPRDVKVPRMPADSRAVQVAPAFQGRLGVFVGRPE